jgi:hypothetical protein
VRRRRLQEAACGTMSAEQRFDLGPKLRIVCILASKEWLLLPLRKLEERPKRLLHLRP